MKKCVLRFVMRVTQSRRHEQLVHYLIRSIGVQSQRNGVGTRAACWVVRRSIDRNIRAKWVLPIEIERASRPLELAFRRRTQEKFLSEVSASFIGDVESPEWNVCRWSRIQDRKSNVEILALRIEGAVLRIRSEIRKTKIGAHGQLQRIDDLTETGAALVREVARMGSVDRRNADRGKRRSRILGSVANTVQKIRVIEVARWIVDFRVLKAKQRPAVCCEVRFQSRANRPVPISAIAITSGHDVVKIPVSLFENSGDIECDLIGQSACEIAFIALAIEIAIRDIDRTFCIHGGL